MTLYVSDGLSTSQIISGLEHGTVYEVTVVAINSAGMSPESNRIKHKTIDDNILGSVYNYCDLSIHGPIQFTCRTFFVGFCNCSSCCFYFFGTCLCFNYNSDCYWFSPVF